MHFSRLPEAIFLQMFRILPLQDQIRLSRVSQVFQRIFETAIYQARWTKFVVFDTIQNSDLEWLQEEINSCSNSLEEVVFRGNSAMEAFSRLTYPRLKSIHYAGSISKEAFDQLFQNNKNLQQFQWYTLDGERQVKYFPCAFRAGVLVNL